MPTRYDLEEWLQARENGEGPKDDKPEKLSQQVMELMDHGRQSASKPDSGVTNMTTPEKTNDGNNRPSTAENIMTPRETSGNDHGSKITMTREQFNKLYGSCYDPLSVSGILVVGDIPKLEQTSKPN